MSLPNAKSSAEQHVALLIEVPMIYTDDLDGMREYRGEFESESDWLLNCIATGGPVRLRLEVTGDKDSDVNEVWGYIREAQLVEPSRGYEVSGHLTDEQLEEHGSRLMPDDDEPVKAATRLRGKIGFKLDENGRNHYGLVCADCGATWIPGDMTSDSIHLGDDWKRCPSHYIEVNGVD